MLYKDLQRLIAVAKNVTIIVGNYQIETNIDNNSPSSKKYGFHEIKQIDTDPHHHCIRVWLNYKTIE